jgi:hypothetical protein
MMYFYRLIRDNSEPGTSLQNFQKQFRQVLEKWQAPLRPREEWLRAMRDRESTLYAFRRALEPLQRDVRQGLARPDAARQAAASVTPDSKPAGTS